MRFGVEFYLQTPLAVHSSYVANELLDLRDLSVVPIFRGPASGGKQRWKDEALASMGLMTGFAWRRCYGQHHEAGALDPNRRISRFSLNFGGPKSTPISRPE